MMTVKRNVLPSSETAEQITVVEYCDIKNIPVVHIPNEGKRSQAYGASLKRMGLRKGFPDLFIPVVRGNHHGLFIEMKYGNGKTTEDQKKWLSLLSSEGYACAVCYNADEAIKTIGSYMRLKKEGIQ